MAELEYDHNLTVQVNDLVKTYGELVAVDHLSFQVHRGEFFGFLGPNGAGKSTTIKILCGLVRQNAGTAQVLGFDTLRQPLEVKRRIGILPEDVNLYERLTGWELLQFSGRIHRLPQAEIEQRGSDLLDLMSLSDDDARKLIVDYSMGMKKKIALACALLHNPRVLFLDEPFNGVDTVTSMAIRNVLQRATDRGLTIFFSSHIMEVVERLCTRVAIINKGRIVAIGTLDQIRQTAGAAEGTSLDDLFVRLVAGGTDHRDLDWLRDT